MKKADMLIRWLIAEARWIPDCETLLSRLAPKLVKAGIPVWRISFNMTHIHPQLGGIAYRWFSDTEEVTITPFDRSRLGSTMFLNSPLGLLSRLKIPLHWDLTERDAALEFPLFEELAEEGATSYSVFPLMFRRGRIGGFSLTTRSPDGFSPDHLTIMSKLIPALTMAAENFRSEVMLQGLLSAYLGRRTSQRVLDGTVTLGGSQSVDAVVLFADLRDSTAMSERLDRREMLSLLNKYFGIVVGAVHARGGEVLKFLGDGVLAIFPIDGALERDEACAMALIAALEAQAEVARETNGTEHPLRSGFALHVGRVLYGNIGTPDRLDFTVIGTTVNVASRVQTLCRILEEDVLISADFAEVSPIELRPVGEHHLPGVAHPMALFAPMHKAAAPSDHWLAVQSASPLVATARPGA